MPEVRRIRPSPGVLLLAALGGVVAVVYPAAVERALAAWGPRAVALAVLGSGLLSVVLLRRRRGLPGLGPVARSLLLALPLLAVVTGDGLPLRLIPAAIQAAVAGIFVLSLRGGSSILREAARRIHPYAPDFIGAYCRTATLAFAALFAAQALVLAFHAIHPPAHAWARQASALVWGPILAATLVEWFVRKALFRYYGDGPIDRLLAALMPPQNTVRGRRSLDYIRGMRRELGLPPPQGS